MKSRTVIGVLAAAGLALAPPLGAGEPATEHLDSMSLQDLMKIEVVTPAAKGQRAAESPAVVSVLTAEQIQDLGVRTLYEALSYLPGVQVVETYFGYTAVNVRGLIQAHYNNKVLLMINGHPSREVVNGSYHLEIVPIEAIERIEFVRGPGSALYGTNAFAGVINVITRKGSDHGSKLLAAGYGSFQTFEAAAGYGHHDDDLDVSLAASYRGDDGYPYRVREDERGQSDTIDYTNDVANLFAHLDYKDFTFELAGFSQDKQKLGITPVLEYNGINEFEGGFADLKWERELAEDLELTARLRYDVIDRRQSIGTFPFNGFQGHGDASTFMQSSGSQYGAEVTLGYSASKRVSILGGVVYEHRQTDPYQFRFEDDGSVHPYSAYLDSETSYDLSAYGQAMVEATSRTNVVLGFRFDSDSDAGAALLPRVGVVQRLTDDVYLKLLYAEAYRTPDFFEKYVATYDVLYGDPSLDRERTRTLDLALDATFAEKYNVQVDAFWLRTSDIITRVPTTRPELTGPNASEYANLDGDEIMGLEVNLMAHPSQRLRLLANYSYLDGESQETGDELEDFARHSANAALVWQAWRMIDVKPNVQYVGSRGAADAYTLLNVVVSIAPSDRWSFDLIGRNLADEEYEYPETIRRIIDTVPGGPERSFMARVRFRY